MQVKRMQEPRSQVALQSRRSGHSLAARRAELEARMREMAVDDLTQVATRLKELRKELQDATGQRWTQQEVADANKISLRTFASWEGAEVENRDGEGYKKLAKFYTRKLGRKVSWQWIVFGDGSDKQGNEGAGAPPDSPLEKLSPSASAAEIADLRARLEWMESALQALLSDRGLDKVVPPSKRDSQQQSG